MKTIRHTRKYIMADGIVLLTDVGLMYKRKFRERRLGFLNLNENKHCVSGNNSFQQIHKKEREANQGCM